MPRTFLDDGRVEFRAAEPRRNAAGASADRRIRDALRNRLGAAGIDLHRLSITAADGIVRLVGAVPTRSVKQAVAEAAARCRGVRGVDNRLRVRRAPGRAE